MDVTLENIGAIVSQAVRDFLLGLAFRLACGATYRAFTCTAAFFY
ncbi:MAG: hypothetical protein R6W69_03985 [Anaerolineales bacterium]